MPGSMLSSWLSGPMLRRRSICSRKSSKSKPPSCIRRRSCLASRSPNSSPAFSSSVLMSPRPRMREASRSGWNASSASGRSPTPRNLIGAPVTARIESAAPPRASPSIFESTTPVISTASWKACAAFTASCPDIASATSRTSVGLKRCRRSAISAIIASSTCSRPAVSTITVLAPISRARSRPPCTICAAGVSTPRSNTSISNCLPSACS